MISKLFFSDTLFSMLDYTILSCVFQARSFWLSVNESFPSYSDERYAWVGWVPTLLYLNNPYIAGKQTIRMVKNITPGRLRVPSLQKFPAQKTRTVGSLTY